MVVPDDGNAYDGWKVRHVGILRKRCDCEKALRSTSALPVCQYFVTVKASPIANETESSWLQAPGQDYAINETEARRPA